MDLRACFIGDSYVLGQGDSSGLGWPGRVLATALAEGVDLTIYNLGVRGDTAAQVATRAASECRARFRAGDRKAVVIGVGANDLAQGVPVADTAARVEEVIAWAERQKFWVFVVSPPPMRDGRAEASARLIEALEAVCAKRKTPFLAPDAQMADWAQWWDEAAKGDGAHPGAESYARIAESFSAWKPWREWAGLR